MEKQYQLKGEWDEKSTILLMKAMFCREVNFSYISNESIEFLKEMSEMGAPFNKTDYKKIFDGFKIDFINNPVIFFKIFLNEIKEIEMPKENIRIFMSSILNETFLLNEFQVFFLKLIRHLIGNKCDSIAEYEAIRKLKYSRTVLNYFLENKIIDYETNNRVILLLEFEHRHKEQEDIFDFPEVFVSEEYLRNEEQGEILILLNSNISKVLKSVTLKYDEINSFQELLDMLYNNFLVTKVSKYSYGNEWNVSKYNGISFSYIDKINNIDTRRLSEIGVNKNEILKINKL